VDAFLQGYWRSPELTFLDAKDARGWDGVLGAIQEELSRQGCDGQLDFSELGVSVLGAGRSARSWAMDLKREKMNAEECFTLAVATLHR